MIKSPFMEELDNRLRPEERIFKFRSAELVGSLFKLELLVDHNAYDDILNDELKNKVYAASKEIIPESFTLNVKYVKANNEETAIIKHIMEFVYKEKPTVYSGFSTSEVAVESGADVVFIQITLEKYLYEYAVNSNMKKEMEEYLQGWIMEDAEVEFIAVPNKEDVIINRRPQVKTTTIGTIKVNINEYFYGSMPSEPRYISDVADKEVAQVVLCGTISNIRVRYIEKIAKNLYTFNLNDSTGNIKVKYFAKPAPTEITPCDEAIAEREKELAEKAKTDPKVKFRKTVNWDKVFVDGAVLVMQGQIKYDNFDKVNVFMPKSVASCTIDYGSINLKKDFLPEPENYVKIFPEPIESQRQENLFATAMNPELAKNIFVVFDTETTGTDANKDDIIEISAVKLVDGEIKEQFSCLINPGRHISEEATAVNNITDEMVANCYKISDVIGDFYKFTRGTILVAHNAPFDISFISIAGKKNLYDFDNAYIDTLVLSRQIMPKLKNHKLGTICKALDVSLVGAHRALNDAVATAQVFVELMNRQGQR